MYLFIRMALVAIVAFASLGCTPSDLLAQGNVEGTTYTSPHFDYQVQWGAPWYFVEESSEEGIDYVTVSDGISLAQFRFFFEPSADATEAIAYVTDPANLVEYMTNVQPLVDAQGVPVSGGDATHAWGGVRGQVTLDDGSTFELVHYHDVRILPGGVVAWATARTPVYYYDDTVLLSWQNLFSTAVIVPETTPAEPGARATAAAQDETTAPPVETAVPEPPVSSPPLTVEGGVGEPAPAFAAGPWRIAARAVDQGETIPYLGLTFVDGMRWVVLYADLTNWSTTDAQLDIFGMTLLTASGPLAADLTATQSTATALGLEPANGSSVIVAAGASTRLAIVYSAPVAETELVLGFQEAQLPLKDAVGQQLDVTDLSTIATPPQIQVQIEAGIPVVISGPLELIAFGMDGELLPVTLAGVDVPGDATCYDSTTTMMTILGLEDTPLWLETDPAVSEPDTYYVWYMDDQGNWVMLNQQLIAEGMAIEGDLPNAARFGAWIEQTEKVARSEGVGLWSTCAGQL